LRQIDERSAATDAILFKPATAVRLNPDSFYGTPLPPEEPRAKNPPDGAVIDFYLKSAPSAAVTIDVLDGKGAVVRSYSSAPQPPAPRRALPIADYWLSPPSHLTARAGMNRFVWDLRYSPPADDGTGPQVLPGTYTLRLNAAGRTLTQSLDVTADPRSAASPLELQKRFELSISLWRDMKRAEEVIREGNNLRQSGKLSTDGARILGAAAAGRGGRGGGGSGAPTIASVLGAMGAALSVAESADRTPPATAYELARQSARDLDTLLAQWKSLPK